MTHIDHQNPELAPIPKELESWLSHLAPSVATAFRAWFTAHASLHGELIALKERVDVISAKLSAFLEDPTRDLEPMSLADLVEELDAVKASIAQTEAWLPAPQPRPPAIVPTPMRDTRTPSSTTGSLRAVTPPSPADMRGASAPIPIGPGRTPTTPPPRAVSTPSPPTPIPRRPTMAPPPTPEDSAPTPFRVSLSQGDQFRFRMLEACVNGGQTGLEREQKAIQQQFGLDARQTGSHWARCQGRFRPDFIARVIQRTPKDRRIEVRNRLADLYHVSPEQIIAWNRAGTSGENGNGHH